MQHPQRGGIRRMVGHDDMLANVRRKRAQQLGAVDRLGPRFRFRQTQCTTLLAAVTELVAFGRDEAIERRRADIETLGSVLALALVFQPAELGQPADFAVSIRGQLDPVPMAVSRRATSPAALTTERPSPCRRAEHPVGEIRESSHDPAPDVTHRAPPAKFSCPTNSARTISSRLRTVCNAVWSILVRMASLRI